MEGRLQLANISVRTFLEFSADVGEGLREGAIGWSSRGLVRGSCRRTKPTYVDPGFTADGDRFRLEVAII